MGQILTYEYSDSDNQEHVIKTQNIKMTVSNDDDDDEDFENIMFQQKIRENLKKNQNIHLYHPKRYTSH